MLSVVDNGIEFSGSDRVVSAIGGGAEFKMLGEAPAGTNLVIGIEIYAADGSSLGKISKKWKDLNERYVHIENVAGAGAGRLGPNDSKDLLHIEVEDLTTALGLTGKMTFAGNTKGQTLRSECHFFTGNGYGEVSGMSAETGFDCSPR